MRTNCDNRMDGLHIMQIMRALIMLPVMSDQQMSAANDSTNDCPVRHFSCSTNEKLCICSFIFTTIMATIHPKLFQLKNDGEIAVFQQAVAINQQ